MPEQKQQVLPGSPRSPVLEFYSGHRTDARTERQFEKMEKSFLMIASVIHDKRNLSDLLPTDKKESNFLVDPEIATGEEATE